MKNNIDQIIEELKKVVESDSYFVGSGRGIKTSGDGSNWIISNIANHVSSFTVQISSFQEAAIIISKVSENDVQVSELTSRFEVDLKLPLFLHLL
jgi:hypothetical protein